MKPKLTAGKTTEGETTMGQRLGRLLGDAISAIDSNEDDERSRSDVIEQMAEAADVETNTVNQIVNGSIDCPPEDRLRAFATVNGIPSFDDQREAAGQDGCRYGDAENSDAADDSESTADDDKTGAAEDSGGADQPLERYRETFGTSVGSVLWSDGTPFVDACESHIKGQNEQLQQLRQQLADANKQLQKIGAQLHGEDEPLDAGPDGDAPASGGGDAIAAYAEGLKLPQKQ